MKKAIYPGSFDPITFGHIDIIKRSLKLVDELIIAVGNNSNKSYMFSIEDRMVMIKESLKEIDLNVNPKIKVELFDGLLVDYAQSNDTNIIIRGLRAMSDFDYEFQMGLLNRKFNSDIETIFLITDQKYLYYNSSLVKEVAKNKGPLSCIVPEAVIKYLSRIKNHKSHRSA
ncbi:pantetheine-phosphate adenylyltransferase [Candidatus Woesearchaeota archaeon]|nr:pantetheine-phosphate adenylyltransferase [Candidatus Woesearchaeota archaeon]